SSLKNTSYVGWNGVNEGNIYSMVAGDSTNTSPAGMMWSGLSSFGHGGSNPLRPTASFNVFGSAQRNIFAANQLRFPPQIQRWHWNIAGATDQDKAEFIIDGAVQQRTSGNTITSWPNETGIILNSAYNDTQFQKVDCF